MINNKFFRQQRQKIQFNVAAVDVEVVQLCNKQILTSSFFIFFFFYVGVRASLRVPRLISRPTEHPANPVGM
jgi:hypothetical protein